MPVKDKLQIILITYNRAKYVKKTFERFFFENSPVADCEFIVQDNNSTDETKKIVEEFAKLHPNVKYTKNKYNLGVAGTIARAMEVAAKEYVWIIGDDDIFNFSNWQEVENAINNKEDIICVSRYSLPDERKDDVANQLFQLTFITGGIYKTSIFNDTTIRNSFDTVCTLFPHLNPIINFVNKGGKIYVVREAIADNGMYEEEKDYSYVRGTRDISQLTRITRNMVWILGYAILMADLKDRSIAEKSMRYAISYKDIFVSYSKFYDYMLSLISSKNYHYYYIIFRVLDKKLQKACICFTIRKFVTNHIFSVTNRGNHKVWNILGLKIKYKRRKK